MAEDWIFAQGPQKRGRGALGESRRQRPFHDADVAGARHLGQLSSVGFGGEAHSVQAVVVGLEDVELETDAVAVAELPQPDGSAFFDDDRSGVAISIVDPASEALVDDAGAITPPQRIGIPQRQK